MNKGLIIPLMFFWMMLPSCQHDNLSSKYPYLNNEEELVTLLFTENAESEPADHHAYYDALLDFQQEYPDALSKVHAVDETDHQLMQYYEVTDFPAMIILDGEEVQLRLEGSNDYTVIKDEIKNKVLAEDLLTSSKRYN
ncbi:hypothetical protein [Alkalicoccus daliensis]|uniref:Small peptidoglycan-associated lipoprotein n=1 Tax=Alkalicoccus daliensis TaxID=745820 RepID=A0A1G9ZQX0_9BACI|nr:hypothetical protein [Alkalicoccus daliensis]SDN23487.1 hypothetical protein SAMN04488053_101201 [Alkalicoccus daliensis]